MTRRILLTNDDSHRSPLLAFVIRALQPYGEVTVVVPKHEQSWRSKSMTRFGSIHLESWQVAGCRGYMLDGTPADCVNLALHHLFDGELPDLVVSGINAGLNAGVGFIFSSGTVGAGFEANIAGVPAIALSQMFDPPTMSRYVSDYQIAPETTERLFRQLSPIVARVLDTLIGSPELLHPRVTWNVNFPFQLIDPVAIELCGVSPTYYGSCFRGDGTTFRHESRSLVRDEGPDGDLDLLHRGIVTVSCLDLRRFGLGPDALVAQARAAFGRRGGQ